MSVKDRINKMKESSLYSSISKAVKATGRTISLPKVLLTLKLTSALSFGSLDVSAQSYQYGGNGYNNQTEVRGRQTVQTWVKDLRYDGAEGTTAFFGNGMVVHNIDAVMPYVETMGSDGELQHHKLRLNLKDNVQFDVVNGRIDSNSFRNITWERHQPGRVSYGPAAGVYGGYGYGYGPSVTVGGKNGAVTVGVGNGGVTVGGVVRVGDVTVAVPPTTIRKKSNTTTTQGNQVTTQRQVNNSSRVAAQSGTRSGGQQVVEVNVNDLPAYLEQSRQQSTQTEVAQQNNNQRQSAQKPNRAAARMRYAQDCR